MSSESKSRLNPSRMSLVFLCRPSRLSLRRHTGVVMTFTLTGGWQNVRGRDGRHDKRGQSVSTRVEATQSRDGTDWGM